MPTNFHGVLLLLSNVGRAVLFLLITYAIARVISGRLRSGLERAQLGSSVAILLSRTLWVSVWAIGVLYVVYDESRGIGPLTAFIGVLGLAASLSLQTVLQNLVAGVYLLAERPFAIGDTIAVVGPSGLNHEGSVEDIQMRTTQLRTRDGELVLVPNGAIFSGVITNRTAVGGYIRQVQVTFPRDAAPEQIRAQIVPLLRDLPSILDDPVPQVRVDSVAKEQWTACVNFWSRTVDGDADVAWTIARAFPQATVNDPAPA